MKKIGYCICVLSLMLSACKSNEPASPSPSAPTRSVMAKSIKRGVSFNFSSLIDAALLSPSISWSYNWGNDQLQEIAEWYDMANVMYCPMCWNQNFNAERIRTYVKAHPSTQYLLAFNEPNLKDQANMTPTQAAQYWPDVVALAKELNLKLVSPAMNYGTLSGYSDPIKWLDEFFEQPGVSIGDIDVISIHCYMGSASAMEGFVERFRKYSKPVWLTEFCAWETGISSVNKQIAYMCAALNFLEQSDLVERYAWFIPRASMAVTAYPYMQLLTHTDPIELTTLGQLYTQFSTFDKQAYLPLSSVVSAHLYVGLSNIGSVLALDETDNTPYVSSVSGNNWFEYQINSDGTQPLCVTYQSLSDNQVQLMIDGAVVAEITLPKMGSLTEWSKVATSYIPPSGNHTLRFFLTVGSMNVKSFSY